MTDKPPGKLQSDLENETVAQAAAQLSSLQSFLAEERKKRKDGGARCGCELRFTFPKINKWQVQNVKDIRVLKCKPGCGNAEREVDWLR